MFLVGGEKIIATGCVQCYHLVNKRCLYLEAHAVNGINMTFKCYRAPRDSATITQPLCDHRVPKPLSFEKEVDAFAKGRYSVRHRIPAKISDLFTPDKHRYNEYKKLKDLKNLSHHAERCMDKLGKYRLYELVKGGDKKKYNEATQDLYAFITTNNKLIQQLEENTNNLTSTDDYEYKLSILKIIFLEINSNHSDYSGIQEPSDIKGALADMDRYVVYNDMCKELTADGDYRLRGMFIKGGHVLRTDRLALATFFEQINR